MNLRPKRLKLKKDGMPGPKPTADTEEVSRGCAKPESTIPAVQERGFQALGCSAGATGFYWDASEIEEGLKMMNWCWCFL